MAVTENFFHWKHGQKSLVKTIEDTALKTAISAGIGIISSTGFAIIPSTMGPVIAPLFIVGGIVYIGTTVYRVIQAAKPELNLDEFLNKFYNTTLQKGMLLGKK